MSYIVVKYTGDAPGGVIHYAPGADFEHPGRADHFDFRGGAAVRIESPPEDPATLDKYRQLRLLNPDSWIIVEEG